MKFENQYLKYEEYLELGGEMEKMPFNLLEFETRKIIDSRTQCRLIGIEEIPQEVKLCINALINCILSYTNKNHNNNIASKSIDGVSVSYVTGSQIQEAIKSKDYEIDNIIMTFLSGVIVNNEHILYLGVC